MIFSNNKLQLAPLIKELGEEHARQYLQWLFAKPENFFLYAYTVFGEHIQNAIPLFHIETVSDILDGFFANDDRAKRFGRGAPRGGAKSTLINLILNSWFALNGYVHFTLMISDVYNQAKMHLNTLKNEIDTNPILNFIYPDARGGKWGEEGILINNKYGQTLIMPLGAGMKVRGLKFNQYRPQLAIIDDLENLEAVYSSEQRKKLKAWLDYDLEPALDRYTKVIIYIGTILHYNSLLKQVLHNEGKYKSWNTKIYKAIENNQSFWQDRFSLEYLTQIRDNPEHPDYVGSIVFAQEYQNEPQDDKDRIIQVAWLKDYSLTAKIKEFTGEDDAERLKNFIKPLERYAGVDPAISEKETADNFSMYAFGYDKTNNIEYQLDLVHGKFNINEQVTIICDKTIEWDLDGLGIESVAYQKGLAQLVKTELNKRGWYKTRVMEIKTDKDKIRRAKIHSSAFESGYILLRNDHNKYNIISSEILEFPLAEKDDAFDSLMIARETRKGESKSRVFAKKPIGF